MSQCSKTRQSGINRVDYLYQSLYYFVLHITYKIGCFYKTPSVSKPNTSSLTTSLLFSPLSHHCTFPITLLPNLHPPPSSKGPPIELLPTEIPISICHDFCLHCHAKAITESNGDSDAFLELQNLCILANLAQTCGLIHVIATPILLAPSMQR